MANFRKRADLSQVLKRKKIEMALFQSVCVRVFGRERGRECLCVCVRVCVRESAYNVAGVQSGLTTDR